MQSYPINSTKVQTITNDFIRSVYNWMGIGLALTGLIAYYVSTDISIQNLIFGNKLVFFGLIIGGGCQDRCHLNHSLRCLF